MANFSALQSVKNILNEVLKLSHRNKEIFFFIFLSTFIPSILLILAFVYSLTSVSTDLSMDNAISSMIIDPSKLDHFKQLLFFLLGSAITLFSMMNTVYVSAVSYLGRDLKLKDLFMKINKIWIRPVVTWFYITLIFAGFLFVLVAHLVLLFIFSKGSIIVLTIGIVLVLLAICLNMYIALVSMLSIVTSVLEDSYGLQAIRKGAQLLKGRKLVGFVLTFILMTLFGFHSLVSMMIKNMQMVPLKLLISFCAMIFVFLVKILSMMIYTVFYFDCKRSHGEKVEVEENMGYTKVSTLPLVDSALP
ncbi:hypothetical protein AQUCO_00400018v1 [Aquilegia coerulea]|uniref:Uncharacterized protein n=1 Tax=Aquilegia coerulea TaxID=218851 RepID=A0A2G5ESZ6_AQUCA|nr:hypothetical protein AQUCO_00400018v1 [Aquilegia coerulea]